MVVWGWGAVGRGEGQLHGYRGLFGVTGKSWNLGSGDVAQHSEGAKTHHVLHLKTVK